MDTFYSVTSLFTDSLELNNNSFMKFQNINSRKYYLIFKMEFHSNSTPKDDQNLIKSVPKKR